MSSFKKFLSGLVPFDGDDLVENAKDNKIQFPTYKDLTNRAEFIKLIQEERGVIPIMTVKRKVDNEGFRDIISDMYQRS